MARLSEHARAEKQRVLLDLWCRARSGDEEAQNAFVSSFIGLAGHFAARYQSMGLPMEDLVAEGKLAILKACNSYDPSKGTSLTYYVSSSIRFALCTALTEQSRLVRVPRGKQHSGNGASTQSCSLDQPLDDTELTLADTLPDPCVEPPDVALDQQEAHALLRRTVRSLPKPMQDTLEARFGLHGGTPLTKTELARQRGVSHQAVQQHEAHILKLLRKRLAPHLAPDEHMPVLARSARPDVPAPHSSARSSVLPRVR